MKNYAAIIFILFCFSCATHTGPGVTKEEYEKQKLVVGKEKKILEKEVEKLRAKYEVNLKKHEDKDKDWRDIQQARLEHILKRLEKAKEGNEDIPQITLVYPNIWGVVQYGEIALTTNAWTDGFQIWFTEELLKICKNDDEIASILSHERAHMYRDHLVGAYLQGIAGAVLEGVQPGSSNVLLLLTPFTKEKEKEADLYGLINMYKAGYDLNAFIRVWKKFSVVHPSSQEEGLFILQTHPNSIDRQVKSQKTIDLIKKGIDPIKWEEDKK